MPDDSPLYEKVIPRVLLLLAVITGGLILFAAGVLLGWVNF